MNFRTLAIASVAFLGVNAATIAVSHAEICSDGTILRHESFYGQAKAKEECDKKHGGTAFTCFDGKQCYPAGGPIRPGVSYCTRSTPPGSGRTGPVKQCS